MLGVDDNALRLRAYLLTLTPQARLGLRHGLEPATTGREASREQAALAELRRLADDADGAAVRLFFRPLAPFLIDDATRQHSGWVARSSLPALWAFVCHDLVHEEAAAFTQAATEALEAGAVLHADRLTNHFQDRVVAALRAAMATAEDDLGRRRLAMCIGTPRAAGELAALRWTLRGRDALAGLSARLPATIDDLLPQSIPVLTMLIESAARPRELFVYALLMVFGRLAAPWQIVRLAAHAASSTSAARIAETPYGIVIDILLADIEHRIGALGAALADGDGAGAVALMRSIDAAIRGLRAEIIVPVGSTLGRRLSALDAEAAALARAALRPQVAA
jgi:hypothetical protein